METKDVALTRIKKMSVAELKAALRSRNQHVTGTKPTLISRLCKSYDNTTIIEWDGIGLDPATLVGLEIHGFVLNGDACDLVLHASSGGGDGGNPPPHSSGPRLREIKIEARDISMRYAEIALDSNLYAAIRQLERKLSVQWAFHDEGEDEDDDGGGYVGENRDENEASVRTGSRTSEVGARKFKARKSRSRKKKATPAKARLSLPNSVKIVEAKLGLRRSTVTKDVSTTGGSGGAGVGDGASVTGGVISGTGTGTGTGKAELETWVENHKVIGLRCGEMRVLGWVFCQDGEDDPGSPGFESVVVVDDKEEDDAEERKSEVGEEHVGDEMEVEGEFADAVVQMEMKLLREADTLL